MKYNQTHCAKIDNTIIYIAYSDSRFTKDIGKMTEINQTQIVDPQKRAFTPHNCNAHIHTVTEIIHHIDFLYVLACFVFSLIFLVRHVIVKANDIIKSIHNQTNRHCHKFSCIKKKEIIRDIANTHRQHFVFILFQKQFIINF